MLRFSHRQSVAAKVQDEDGWLDATANDDSVRGREGEGVILLFAALRQSYPGSPAGLFKTARSANHAEAALLDGGVLIASSIRIVSIRGVARLYPAAGPTRRSQAARAAKVSKLPALPGDAYFTFTPSTAKGPGFSATPETLPG
jgi:hypothetical protein